MNFSHWLRSSSSSRIIFLPKCLFGITIICIVVLLSVQSTGDASNTRQGYGRGIVANGAERQNSRRTIGNLLHFYGNPKVVFTDHP